MTDYISRQAAIEALLEKGQYSKRYRLGDIWELNFDEIRETIATVPSAQPIKHAHWIWKGDEGDSRFMCSECRCMENAPTCMGIPNIWEYCPNCGSRMEEYELARKRANTETD